MIEKCITELMSHKREAIRVAFGQLMEYAKLSGIACSTTSEDVYLVEHELLLPLRRAEFKYIISLSVDDVSMMKMVLIQLSYALEQSNDNCETYVEAGGTVKVDVYNDGMVELYGPIVVNFEEVFGAIMLEGFRNSIDNALAA